MSNLKRQLIKVAYTTKNRELKKELVSLLKQAEYGDRLADYSEEFYGWVRSVGPIFKHPETGNMVRFDSLPSPAQTEEHDKYEAGKYEDQGGPDASGKHSKAPDKKYIYGEGPYQFTGKFKDREVLYGVPKKSMEDKANLGPELRALAIPTEDIEKAYGEFFDNATYKQMEELRSNIDRAISNPNSSGTKALLESGYTMDGLKKLSEAMKTKMADVKGRRYNDVATKIGNEYDWESEDADSFYSWRKNKPPKGRKLTPEQLRLKFLREARGPKGEPLDQKAKHRIESMPIAEFMQMYTHIVKDDEEEGMDLAKMASNDKKDPEKPKLVTIFDDVSKIASVDDVRKYLIRVGYYTTNDQLRRLVAKTAKELSKIK
jgi:hypothetical protein